MSLIQIRAIKDHGTRCNFEKGTKNKLSTGDCFLAVSGAIENSFWNWPLVRIPLPIIELFFIY